MSSSTSPASNYAQTPETATPTVTISLAKACDSCARRKIKCILTGPTPPCDYCAHHGTSCTFDRPHGRRRAAKTSIRKRQVAQLGERMERIERLLLERLEHASLKQSISSAPLTDASLVASPGATGRSPKVRGRLSFVSSNQQSIDLYHGIPFLSKEGQMWIRFTGEHALEGSLWHNHRRSDHFQNETGGSELTTMLALPPKSEVVAMLKSFSESEFMTVFPVLDPDLFQDTLHKAYADNALTARACVHTFVTLWSLLCAVDPADSIRPKDLERTAYALAPALLEAKPVIEIIDALVMMTVVHFCCGALQTADVFLSVSTRFLFMVGAHLNHRAISAEDASTKRRASHFRDLFWLCWTFDTDIAFRTGRPPAINAASCDLTLPDWYLRQSPTQQSVWRYPGDLRLSFVKSEAYHKLYSPSALRKPDAELLKDIRELDDMLETWRQSFPSDHRPPLSHSQNYLQPNQAHFRWVILCLEYHHCMSTIHQASSRCKLWAGDTVIQQGVASSHDLALQASRSVLHYFHHVEESLLPHVFWVIIFFPLSAVLTIFCNIVSSPPGEEAAVSDAKMLAEALHEFSKRYKERRTLLSAAQEGHIRHVREFLEELVMLARTMIEEGGESEEQKRLLAELSLA